MITEDDFRRIAVGLKDVVEGAHMGHPDFRADGRVFASLRGDGQRGAVKLTPEQQEELIAAHPRAFSPEAGAWGRGGWTSVHIEHVDLEAAGEALTLARQNLAKTTRSRPASAARAADKRTPRRRRSRR